MGQEISLSTVGVAAGVVLVVGTVVVAVASLYKIVTFFIDFYSGNGNETKMQEKTQYEQDVAEREKKKKEKQIQDEKEIEEAKQKMVSEISYQTKDLVVKIQNCQEVVDKEMTIVSDKFKGMAKCLDNANNSMTPEQKEIVDKAKADFEKYPKIQNEISDSITELKKGFNPDKAEEFLKAVDKVEVSLGSLSTFVNELEQSIQKFKELFQQKNNESFDRIKQQIEIGKQTVIDKFGLRENRYRALKQSVTKNSYINLGRLMNKVAALSLSPRGRESIYQLEEKWEESTQDSHDYTSFLYEFEELVKEKYYSQKNLDKMLSRLNLN